ncbi:hypothetical protein EBB07_29245 [Paenibacillaceae bacterium]|nr:hypothetical protein EBB07_29245 [Paenibacillaceae bacterium]
MKKYEIKTVSDMYPQIQGTVTFANNRVTDISTPQDGNAIHTIGNDVFITSLEIERKGHEDEVQIVFSHFIKYVDDDGKISSYLENGYIFSLTENEVDDDEEYVEIEEITFFERGKVMNKEVSAKIELCNHSPYYIIVANGQKILSSHLSSEDAESELDAVSHLVGHKYGYMFILAPNETVNSNPIYLVPLPAALQQAEEENERWETIEDLFRE